LNYALLLFTVYDRKVEEVVKPFVIEFCEKQVYQKVSERLSDEDLTVELYMALKSLAAHGKSLQEHAAHFKLNEYYNWFATAVDYWLDIVSYKAIIR
jgi:uncharacterized protein YgfB (UPF0149 family)